MSPWLQKLPRSRIFAAGRTNPGFRASPSRSRCRALRGSGSNGQLFRARRSNNGEMARYAAADSFSCCSVVRSPGEFENGRTRAGIFTITRAGCSKKRQAEAPKIARSVTHLVLQRNSEEVPCAKPNGLSGISTA